MLEDIKLIVFQFYLSYRHLFLALALVMDNDIKRYTIVKV